MAVTRAAATALLVVVASACATVRPLQPGMRVEVLTPVDRVPVRDPGVWSTAPGPADRQRQQVLVNLRGALADDLAEKGVQVCEGELEAASLAPQPANLRERALADHVDAVVLPELVAYGEVRRSWLWVLLGQGVVAGVGHGVAAAKVTGRARDGWILGGGEFLLETVTWVGGALVASRTLDPVVIRLWVVPAHGKVARKTGEGMRPLAQWLRRGPPRPQRVASVAHKVLSRLASKLVAKPTKRSGDADLPVNAAR